MTAFNTLDELSHAENPARELLEKLGWTYVPREVLAAERDDEREVLLKGRLRAALLRLNEWMTEAQAEWVVAELKRSELSGLARNQRVHEDLIYGKPVSTATASGQQSRIARFFDFDHPQGGLNEFVVTTQFRVWRGNERRNLEDDQRVVKPDLVLFVNGIPLVVMEAKSPSLMDVWKSKAVRQLRRYQEAASEWHGTGAPELFHTNLLCVAHCGAAAAYATLGAPENAYVEWKSVLPYSDAEVLQRFGVEPKGQAQLIVGLLAPATLLDILRDYVVYEPQGGKLVKKLPRYQQYRAVGAALERLLRGRKPEERPLRNPGVVARKTLTPTLSLSRPDTWWTGVRRHGGHLDRLPQIECAQIVGQEADGPATVGGRRAKGDGLTAQGLGQPELAPLEGHPAAGLDFADLIVGAVGQRRQLGGVGSGTDVIATGGDGQGQRLVGAHMVVLVAPGIEGGLPGGQIGTRRLPTEIALQGAVEALVLAQGLRVIGPAVADGDAQAAQPDRQRGVGVRRVIAPGTAVVDQQAVGHAVALEGRDQVRAHGGGALVGAGDQAQGVARVVVEDRQRMAAAGATGPPGLEVHLPQGVGIGVFEALPGARLAGPLRGVQLVVPPQDGRDGGGRRQRLDALAGQQHPQLAAAPGGVLRPQRQHGPLDGRGRLRRTAVRPPRAVLQAHGSGGRIPVQPLVAGRRRNPKGPAQRPPVRPGLLRQPHKLRPLVRHRSILERHRPIPSWLPNVSTMSPNGCP